MQPVDPRLVALRDTIPGQVLQGSGGLRVYVREVIGEGGQGWVFRANWDDPDGYVVIVKVLRPDAATPEALVRFAREAQVLRMLGQNARPNPHIVRFFDHATARFTIPGAGSVELPFTVLEHVRGPTLEDVLIRSRGAPLALERVRRVGRQVVLALEDVHAQKVVHRDLKPSNVLLASEGGVETAKVTDFGLVKLAEISLGRTTALAGASLGYAPPEQFERGNRRVSARTDVFSFATMLYEMLTGTRAFPYSDRENPLVIVTRLLNGPRPALAATKGSLPSELVARPELVTQLDTHFARATAAEPDERPASITEFWAAVDPLLRAATERTSLQPAAGRLASGIVESVSRQPRQEIAPIESRSPIAEASLANPVAWSWGVKAASLHAGAVRFAVFEPGGEAAIAIGARGFMRWQGPSWTHLSMYKEVDEQAVQGLAWLGSNDLLVYGSRGLVMRVTPGAPPERWPVPDEEVTFLGGHVDGQGTVTLVGEKHAPRATRGGSSATTMGVMAQFVRGRLSVVANAPMCSRLRGVTRLRSGVLLGCGDWGAIVRFELGVAEAVTSACTGHLFAIAALEDGGAVSVGAGAHAIAISSTLRAQLEGVQTTRDLCSLAVDANGAAWTGSAQARLLRRTLGGWVRMSGELGLQSSVVALTTTPRSVRAICDDGAVIEGSVALTPTA
jgi:serine/threonine-protein kinase